MIEASVGLFFGFIFGVLIMLLMSLAVSARDGDELNSLISGDDDDIPGQEAKHHVQEEDGES